MPAGRPHEAIGNGGPRWMAVGCLRAVTEPGLQAGSSPNYCLTCKFFASGARSGPHLVCGSTENAGDGLAGAVLRARA